MGAMIERQPPFPAHRHYQGRPTVDDGRWVLRSSDSHHSPSIVNTGDGRPSTIDDGCHDPATAAIPHIVNRSPDHAPASIVITGDGVITRDGRPSTIDDGCHDPATAAILRASSIDHRQPSIVRGRSSLPLYPRRNQQLDIPVGHAEHRGERFFRQVAAVYVRAASQAVVAPQRLVDAAYFAELDQVRD